MTPHWPSWATPRSSRQPLLPARVLVSPSFAQPLTTGRWVPSVAQRRAGQQTTPGQAARVGARDKREDNRHM